MTVFHVAAIRWRSGWRSTDKEDGQSSSSSCSMRRKFADDIGARAMGLSSSSGLSVSATNRCCSLFTARHSARSLEHGRQSGNTIDLILCALTGRARQKPSSPVPTVIREIKTPFRDNATASRMILPPASRYVFIINTIRLLAGAIAHNAE